MSCPSSRIRIVMSFVATATEIGERIFGSVTEETLVKNRQTYFKAANLQNKSDSF